MARLETRLPPTADDRIGHHLLWQHAGENLSSNRPEQPPAEASRLEAPRWTGPQNEFRDCVIRACDTLLPTWANWYPTL